MITEQEKKTEPSGFLHTLNAPLASRKDKEFFVENLSMLLASGMDLMSVLVAIQEEFRSKHMKAIAARMAEDIDSGLSLSDTLAKTKMLDPDVLSLVRIGETSGKLDDNLKVIVEQQRKKRMFRSRLRSAMMYPVLIFIITITVGMVIAWFILPRLALVFGNLKLELPWLTQWLIALGEFLGRYGKVVVPLAILVIAVVFYTLFANSRTKFLGQYFLFSIPPIRKLIKEIELAKFGYILGTLLESGVPVVDAIESLEQAEEFPPYRKLYKHLKESVEEGNSFQRSFALYPHAKKYIPISIQHLIAAGEQSGNLSQTLKHTGQQYE